MMRNFKKLFVGTVVALSASLSLAGDIPENKLSYNVYKANWMSGKPAPTVLLAHTCSGIHFGQTDKMVRYLRSIGYNSVVVDSFGPRGYTSICQNGNLINPAERMQEMIDIARIVKQSSWHTGSVGFLGWSHGGTTAIYLAAQDKHPFDALISIYPFCGPLLLSVTEVKHKVLAINSQADNWYGGAKECDNIKGLTNQYISKTATHAWDIPLPDRTYMGHFLSYDKEADNATMDAIKKYLSDNFKGQ